MRAFSAALAGWAEAGGVDRLTAVLPAPLAQLPWEALAEQQAAPGRLVRAVSLSHWRREAPAPDAAPDAATPWTFYDRGALLLAELEARIVAGEQAQSNQDADSVEVLERLRRHAHAHLILHGEYHPGDPRSSHLKVRRDQPLPLWAPAAVGVGARRLVLSACQSNLSGRNDAGLLGPVGIGPALLVAGARAVLGTLWDCDDLASTVFFHLLVGLEGEEPWRRASAHARVAEAQRRLRALSGAELRALLAGRLGAALFEDIYEPDLEEYLDPPRPFEQPVYWAPYTLLGEWQEPAGR